MKYFNVISININKLCHMSNILNAIKNWQFIQQWMKGQLQQFVRTIMWSEIQNKRNKFASEIRKKQHRNYFDMVREWNEKDLPAIAYLPVLMQNQLYDDIEEILDQIEPVRGNQVNQNLIKEIREKSQDHSSMKVRLLMFQLLNRLHEWGNQDVRKAMQLLQQGNAAMVKQFAFYFQFKGLTYQNSIPFCKSSVIANSEQITATLQNVFTIILTIHCLSANYRIFWLDIAAKAFHFTQCAAKQMNEKFEEVLPLLNQGESAELNVLEQIRVMNIVYKLAEIPQAAENVIRIRYFMKLLHSIKEQSYDILNIMLQICALLIGNSEAATETLTHSLGIMKYLEACSTHISTQIKAKALWALSNIAGSEHYNQLIGNASLLSILFDLQNESKAIKVEKYFCILNLVCSSNAEQLQTLVSKYAVIDVVCDVLLHMTDPNIKNMFLDRLIFALHHLITDYSDCALVLDGRRVKLALQSLYSLSINESQLENLNLLLDAFERAIEKREGKVSP